ncbi:hypothetical protein Mar181_0044 [Marinomonas posidonica IVIA-Po-181]|uniref:Uncharacterized protein n=2 Tax=Marinomonas TaxID=28253 RepID=F6CYY6_MARPP|nr:hypothetical protein Mar181_0044 [Marinomonas posidonica IVIA-Po-181]
MQQWKVYLQHQLSHAGIRYKVTNGGDVFDIKANSIAYLSWLRMRSHLSVELDESRDSIAWFMLEKQLKALAYKAEKGRSNLVSKLYIEESQIHICLNFNYDDEQHVIYVS